ncbi:RNA polymerase sigma factor [Pedobacter borealis]|uniref:RNA polymerase sigma factor n=1 Tax=Pedobacter borealis TaxID=475254 RepID=UPI00049387DE|nr:RNA polymerase sigma-70 factor [Pedobacter borealis]
MIKKEVIYNPADEPLLLQRASEGSRFAYAALYRFFLPKLYQYIYKIIRSKEDTEEILQDIFLKLWEKKEDLKNVHSLNSYLFRIAHNKLMNLYDHQKVKQKAMSYLYQHIEESGATSEDQYIYHQYSEAAQLALNSLPPKRRLVFEMSTQQELSYDEIAVQLQISKSMVKKHLYSANRHIKEYLRLHAGLTATITLAASVLFAC